MDGADSSDPELGGATFTNFNVDAVQEIQSSSGWMPAEIGRGGAGYTNIVTRSGTNGVQVGLRVSAQFRARCAQLFDHLAGKPGRIPPFRRNEFGFTNGGPVFLPHIYDGRGKTYYFGEYQGFRQVLGTTQVFPVPTAEERAGRDTTAYPGRYADRSGGRWESRRCWRDIRCRITRRAHTAFTPTRPPRMSSQTPISSPFAWTINGERITFWPRIV